MICDNALCPVYSPTKYLERQKINACACIRLAMRMIYELVDSCLVFAIMMTVTDFVVPAFRTRVHMSQASELSIFAHTGAIHII